MHAIAPQVMLDDSTLEKIPAGEKVEMIKNEDGKMLWGLRSDLTRAGRLYLESLSNKSPAPLLQTQSEQSAADENHDAPGAEKPADDSSPISPMTSSESGSHENEPMKISGAPAYTYLNNRWANFVVAGQEYTHDEFLENKLDDEAISEVHVPVSCKSCGRPWELKIIHKTVEVTPLPSPESRGLKLGIDYDVCLDDPNPAPIREVMGLEVVRCCDNPEIHYKSFLFEVAEKAPKIKKSKTARASKQPASTKPASNKQPVLEEVAPPSKPLVDEQIVPAVAVAAVATAKPVPDLNEIKRTLSILKKAGRVVELRALKTKEGTWSGYYDNFDELAKDAYDLSARESTPNVYITLQNIKKELIARRTNKAIKFTPSGDTTDDKDVDSFDFLFIDFDPRRPQGISSTDAEKKAAYVLALQVREYLTKNGFASLFCDSGNGYHLLVRIDLPADKENCKLVKDLLSAICRRFGTTAVDMDVRNFNPSRIDKLYGTVARKGEHRADRPWRLSKILEAPTLHTATKDQLIKLLGELKAESTTSQTQAIAIQVGVTEIEDEIDRLGLRLEVGHRQVSTDKDGNVWSKWHLTCPFNEDHKGKDAFIYLATDGVRKGEWGYNCSHNSCSRNKKAEFQKILGGFNFETNSDSKAIARRLSLVKASSLRPKHIRWLWENKILANKPNVFFGEPGLGKGFLGVDFIARMTTGRDFYDCANENDVCDAIVCCSEDSWEETILPRLIVAGSDIERAYFLLEEHGVADNIEEGLMALDRDLPRIAEMLKQNPDVRIIYIDPLATYVGELDPNKDKEVRPIYTAMKTFAEKHDVCFILVAHPNKNEEASAINRLSGAKALTSVFRNTWLVEKDPEDKTARILASVKGNLASEGAKTGLRFRVENVEDTGIVAEDGDTIKNIGRLVWTGETDKDADELLQAQAGGGKEFKQKKEEVATLELLKEYLAEGAQKAGDFYDKAALLGLSERSVKVAKARLKLKHRRIYDTYYWATSEEQLEAKKAELTLSQAVLFRT